MSKTELIWAVVVVISLTIFLAVLAYGINIGYNTPSMAEERVSMENFKTGIIKIDEGVYEVRIMAARYYFDPSVITLKNPVKIIFKIISADVIHGFSIVGTNVNVMVFPGHLTVVTWYPPADLKGSLIIICNEYCGAGHAGMTATLIIER